MKLAEFNQLKTISNQTPIMCFDDYDTFLDSSRKELLNKQISNNSQVFLSSTNLDSSSLDSKNLENKYFEIHNGIILEKANLFSN